AQSLPAQSLPALEWREAPLEDVLYAFAEAAGVDLVFALRLVREVRVSGSYRPGDDPERALHALLRSTGLRAERVRAGQYVLIALPLSVTEDDVVDPEAVTGTLDGRVVDAETGLPLAGAHVVLVDLDLGDVADASGHFALPALPAGEYTVRVSHVGYRPVRLRMTVYPVSPRLPPVVRLRPQAVQAATAEVRTGPRDIGPAPGVTDLGARQAAAIPVALGDGDLAATLAWLPGLTRAGGSGGALVVRGADPSQTRTLRDGVPLFAPWHAFGLYTSFQPEEVAQVRFHRGSLPAALGGGLAAVLEVETREGLGARPRGTLSAGPVATRAVAGLPLRENLGLHVSARRSTLGALVGPSLRADEGALVLTPLGARPGPAGPERPTLAFADAGAKLTARLGLATRLDVDAFLGSDRLVSSGAGRLDEPDFRYTWTSGAASARYRGLIGRRAFASAAVYRSLHYTREALRATPDDPLSDLTAIDLAEDGLVADVDYFRDSERQVRFGGALALRRLEAFRETPARLQAYDARASDLALYVQQTWQPDARWQVQSGLRAEAFGVPGRPFERLTWSPRLHVRFSPVPDRVALRAGVSRQTQAVHRLQARTASGHDLVAARWLLAGGAVPPAWAWQAGAGAEWALTPALGLSADVYLRRSGGMLEDGAEGPRPGPALAEPGVRPSELLAWFQPHVGRAAGLELAARLQRRVWVFGASGALAAAGVRSETGGGWRPAPYGRPLAFGVLAERRALPFSLALRADAESGRPVGGTREPAALRLGATAGYRFEALGLRWDALAQAVVQPFGPPVSGTGALPPGLPLGADLRGVPALPLVSLVASW
ncbi:MAG: TonB-dependent receptor, partial [Rubricoccaceae bacterium]